MMHYVSAVQSRRATRVSLVGPLSLSSSCMLLNFTGFSFFFSLKKILISSPASGPPNILIQCGTGKEGVTTRVCLLNTRFDGAQHVVLSPDRRSSAATVSAVYTPQSSRTRFDQRPSGPGHKQRSF